jgi:hypothetical protein
MCRSIKTMRGMEPPPERADVEAAARQFVRKLSGYREPSHANREVFEAAVVEIADSAERLLDGLVVRSA